MQNVCANQIELIFSEMFQGKNNRHEHLKSNIMCIQRSIYYSYTICTWNPNELCFQLKKALFLTALSNEIDDKQISGF